MRGGGPSISVVAPSYRRRDGLPGFVEPLLAQPELSELVLAVDGSDDGSVEWLSQRAADDSRLVVLDLPNRGAGCTRQAGIEASKGEVVVLLDDDVIARPRLIAGHAQHHRDLGPRLVLGYMPNDWQVLPRGRRGIAWIYRRAYELHCARFMSDPAHVLRGFWGGNCSMPRKYFLEVGFEGLEIERGQDDREFGIRCEKLGIRGRYDRSLRAEHLYDREMGAFRRDCRIQGVSRRLLHEAHSDVLGQDLSRDPEGPHVADAVGMGLPRGARAIWPALARDPAFTVITRALNHLFEYAVRTGHLGMEVAAARGIGSLETMRGVLGRD